MQLVVITPDTDVKNEVAIVNELFAMGLQRLHLRKPAFTVEDHRDYVNAIDERYHPRIVLTGSFELLSEFSLGSIHLNSALRNDKAMWDRIEGLPTKTISTSFHSWDEIRENEFQYGYVFISPVFDSISKQGYKAGIDLAGAMEVKREFAKSNKYCPAIIGLGGVGREQLSPLYENGFDGAAFLGAIWQSGDAVNAFGEIMDATSRLTGH